MKQIIERLNDLQEIILEPDFTSKKGLGGEIGNPLWQQKFVGKKLFDEQGKLALHVGKGAGSDKEHGVDALSGATLTSKGVQGSFDYWFGENGYIPYLNKLKSAGAQ